MHKLIDLFIEKTKWVNVISVVIAVIGLISLFSMKKDLHPPFQFNNVNVSLSYPNASADEVERLITSPLEESLRDIPDLEEMTSKSRAGSMSITLKFPLSVKNISEKIEKARAAVQSELRLLPSDIRNLEVSQRNDSKIFLANLGVTGLDEKNEAHHDFMQGLNAKLKAIKGVAELDSTLKPFHIFIKFDKERLNQLSVTVAQIRSAIRTELNSNAIGYNSVSGKSWLLEYTSSPTDLDRIKNVQIRNNGTGNKLTISQVAEVLYEQSKNDKYQFLLDGVKATELTLFKTVSEDSIKTFELVQKVIADTEKPKGVDIRVLHDGPYFINQQINVLLSNGMGGLLLVLIVLGLTMGWRTSLMTAIGLPISYFGTFFILKLLGISIDLISLIAMILVVGNLVDDAVIFAERYNQLLAEGVLPKNAASTAAKELIAPVTATILTIICAFMPILLIDSELSVIFFAIPIVISVSLLLSWFETFFILPNHLQHYVKKPEAEKATNLFFWLSSRYKIVLKHTLKFRYLYGLVSIGVLVFTFMTAAKMPQNFNLSINAPQVELFITLKHEYSHEKIIEIFKPLHTKVLALPKDQLDFIETNLGWVYSQGKSYRGAKYATMRLVLDKKQVDTKRLRDTVQREVDEILKTYKPAEIDTISLVAGERGSNERRTDLATIKIDGKDEQSFAQARDEILKLVKLASKNVAYVLPENDGPDTFRFDINRQKLADMGISKEQLGLQIQSLTGPYEILETRSKGRWMNIYLEPKQYQIPSVQSLNQLQIQPFNDGQEIALSQLGNWISTGFSESIEHKDGTRNLKLDFKYDGKTTNELVIQKELSEIILPLKQKYPSLNIQTVDANEQDKKGRTWALKVVLLAGICIYLILAITLGSFLQPLIVGLPIPFAVIGVIWALKLHGMQLSLMVMLGLIGTMGVAVNDSIVMVHQVNLLWKKFGIESAELLIEAAGSRLRAIILTASCTLIGVFPTAYGIGGESGFTQPLAFAMGWGLTASLLLTLFIIPSMMMVLKDMKQLFGRLARKIKKSSTVRPKDSQIDLHN
ncbi:MAG: efflux RND transporter permease subunit [Bdellovibrionota bacterium]